MQDHLNESGDEQDALDSLKTIGAFLKQTRQDKNLSAKDLAESLHMGQEQIIALENGDWELLPEEVFIKAIIQFTKKLFLI